MNKGLSFNGVKTSNDIAMGLVDSDFAGCVDTRKSQTGLVFIVFGTTVSWKVSLQQVVALSTTEVKYMPITEVVKEAIWLKGVLTELDLDQKCIQIWSDSLGAIHLSKNQVFHERSKHIGVKMHFVRDVVEAGEVEILKIHTTKNPADMFTKPVHGKKFLFCQETIDIISLK